MRRLTLWLLLDAFRPDYLTFAPYLRTIAGGRVARFKQPFGFLPHAAYFGGLTPEAAGFTNMYCYDPDGSPFGVARALAGVRLDGGQERAARAFIDGVARSRVPAYAGHYVSCGQIPLDLAADFGVAERRAPWDPQVGYQSLFHQLSAAGRTWYAQMWPETARLADGSDRGIVAGALRALDGSQRFAFVHLQELDACGHWSGPFSREIQVKVAATDRLVEELLETLRRRYDHVDLVAFGDHGMVPVTSAVDVASVLAALPVRRGVDYSYFLDSTLARFWFRTDRARAFVLDGLGSCAGGAWLAEGDCTRLQIAKCDRRNGEAMFLAEPGVVIAPNFFQGAGAELRGMHGYDSDKCPDNLGVLVCDADVDDAPAGVVGATALHEYVRRLTFDDSHARARRHSAQALAERTNRRFTRHPRQEAEDAIAAQLRCVVSVLNNTCPSSDAIVLAGSFGRGEGGVFWYDDAYRAVNDFDIFVVGGVECQQALTRAGERLRRQLGLDFVDLTWTDGSWAQWSNTVANFDLKYGSTVLHGSPALLDRMPPLAAGDLPISEATQLLLNRIGGLLSGLTGSDFTGRSTRSLKSRRYLMNQYVKAAVAVGDAYLLRWRAYDASYAVRRERFAALAAGAGVSRELRDRVVAAYSLKLVPDYGELTDVIDDVRALVPSLLACLRETLAIETGSASAKSLDHALEAYCRAAGPSTRRAVYSMLPRVIAAIGDERPFVEPREWMSHAGFDVPHTIAGWHEWEALREHVVGAWFALIH
jgi:hypothetical protein